MAFNRRTLHSTALVLVYLFALAQCGKIKVKNSTSSSETSSWRPSAQTATEILLNEAGTTSSRSSGGGGGRWPALKEVILTGRRKDLSPGGSWSKKSHKKHRKRKKKAKNKAVQKQLVMRIDSFETNEWRGGVGPVSHQTPTTSTSIERSDTSVQTKTRVDVSVQSDQKVTTEEGTMVPPDETMMDYEWNEDNISIDFMTG